MSDTELTVGERLKIARKLRKKSQEEIGVMVGLKKSAISHIEKGLNKLSADKAVIISSQLQINTSWLLTGEGEMYNLGHEQSESRKAWRETTAQRIKSSNIILEKQLKLSEEEKLVNQRVFEVFNYLLIKENLTTDEFFEKIGLDMINLSGYHAGRMRINVGVLINICSVYFVNPKWLLFGEEEMFQSDQSRFEKSLNTLEYLSNELEFFKENKRNISQRINLFEHEIKYVKKQINFYYKYFEQTHFDKIVNLLNIPIKELTDFDLSIIGIERSFDYREYEDLFFTKDSDDAKIYFNQVDGKFELMGFLHTIVDENKLEEDKKVSYKDLKNGFKTGLDASKSIRWEIYKLSKLMDIQTTEELINEVLQWKFKGLI